MRALAEARVADGGYAYHLLRVSVERAGRSPIGLGAEERAQLLRLADRSFEIEALALGSGEAREVEVHAEAVDAAYRTVAGRYVDETELVSDLARNGLDPQSLRESLERELRFHGVMERVGAGCASVDDA